MGEIEYTSELTSETSRQRRIGGYYQTVEQLEQAASMMEFDVIVPPRHKVWGYWMVPAPQKPKDTIIGMDDPDGSIARNITFLKHRS